MHIEETLENLGLSKAESAIYLSALELGRSLPKHLADKSGVKRPTLYKLLPNLFSKGLLSETMIGKRRFLVAEDPESYVEKKAAELELIQKRLPELRMLLATASVKPKIVFYEGVEGVKKIYLDNLHQRKPTLNFVGLENIHPAIDEYASNYYIPRRIKYGIAIDILLSGVARSAEMNLKTDPAFLRRVKTLDSKKFPLPLDCYIYGDNASFALWRKDSEPIGLIIRSKEIAATMRSLFYFIWESTGEEK
ncbi:MAG: hypothetical protein A2751_02150 [Candidatus Doudnabacteria bacterium RIFCSPHIGHO2_01_FULL_46_14]|uniref:Transcription regulator TrmB N-terminal domain-containing protein n=1 Tax=Candidatus Doudnabacteria bacterium RIFCSPHIGHO2_01_FULL_46_14 TaxID=1817824 RepID=A0A1F5NJN2_9BACT|nr:MAG: hypothetical protein A2751_02150 [Candidatus Doudnabacteria bacterium RIFCSPHIGHO2_01_FULL_46_14]